MILELYQSKKKANYQASFNIWFEFIRFEIASLIYLS